ncbi:universal stress protein [Winogradskyella endarachnes]|uniref:Universal stress protein n=1 Tax=Winogradskyella endarachnes TaxID=2681965 RepID=A0A6L6UCJ4_9FLAO|nr:universal stress protein [Winogradskyella endarachnes]MUU79689.1 universal stress protein [Winogradskyella endarachnes]
MKNILLPTDFSDNSWNAIKYAIQLFKDEICTFHLLNTYTPIIYNVEYVLGYPAQFGLGDAIRDTAQENLKDLTTKISQTFEKNPKHKFITVARFNTLISGVKEYTSEHQTDLIIMGTKGATGAEEILFGSNTVHVFKEIKCPVLAIPSGFKFEKPLEILFPTDLEVDYNAFKIEILKQIAMDNHSRINALHVSTGNDLTFKQINSQLKLESLFKGSSYLFHIYDSMNVTDAINKFQIKAKINLIAMINNKHSFFENLFHRSPLNQIGFHLKVPFLVLPSKQP